jgi:peroxiredoxin Q/BCP
MKALWILLALQLCVAPAAPAQTVKDTSPPPPGSTAPPGTDAINTRQRIRGSVHTGEMAPDFELPASSGQTMRLSSLRPSWTLLVFAERKEGLGPLASIREEMAGLGVKIVGVCDEKAYHLVSYVQKKDPGFPLMADVTGEISGLYGLYDSRRRTTDPGFFMIDPEGKVRMALLGQQIRPADMASLVHYAVHRP